MSTQNTTKRLRWKEPKEVHKVSRKAWRKMMQEIRTPFDRFIQWCAIITLIILASYFIWNQRYGQIVVALLIGFGLWALNQMRTFYEIGEKGILYETGTSRQRYKWKDIESYSIGPSSWVEGMEEVTFSITTWRLSNEEISFDFDPQALDKTKLLQVIELYLPNEERPMSSRKTKERKRFRKSMTAK